MASDPNGWPDASKPSYPANPERDGWHWLMIDHGAAHPFPMLWCSSGDMRESGDDGYVVAADISTRWRYLGPCLTPAEVAAAVQAERAAIGTALEAEAIRLDALAAKIIAQPPEETEPGHCKTIDNAILAALKVRDCAKFILARGDTSALDAALAKARREGMEEAARIVEAMPWPVTGTMQMPATQYDATAAIRRAAAGEAGE